MLKKGNDITIISISYMTIEALKTVNFLKKHKILCELIDLRTVSPIDYKTLNESIKKTGRVVVLDTANSNGSIAGEIIARISMNLFNFLIEPPCRIALPDVPTPTSFSLTKNFYPGPKAIADTILKILNKKIDTKELLKDKKYHDIPGKWFKGPF
jgi:pyruvate dehydrogenase E1 component beta subunit